MRYKSQFQPTYVLDPETNEWNLYDNAMREALDTKIYYSPGRPDAKYEFVDPATIPEGEGGKDWGEEDEYNHIWANGMPGIPAMDEIEKLVDLAKVKVYLKEGGHITASVSTRVLWWQIRADVWW